MRVLKIPLLLLIFVHVYVYVYVYDILNNHIICKFSVE